MKSYRLLFVALLLCTAANAQNPRHQARVEERDARHQVAMRIMDSIVLSRHYCFTPISMEVEPAGRPLNIYDVRYNITMNGDEDVDIFIPCVVGITPPYHLRVLNYVMTYMSDYRAVQNQDGWNISFSTRTPDGVLRDFVFTVYSITGETTLDLTSEDEQVTVTYSGTLRGTY